MPKFKKKPVEIEAFRLPVTRLGFDNELLDFLDRSSREISVRADGAVFIDTLEGRMLARPGDWIIKGTAGEFYPCKPDIFEDVYEAI